METINPGLVVFLMMLGIVTSMAAGVYIRYRLRNSEFVRSDKGFYAQMGALFLSMTLTFSLAAARLHVLTFAALILTSGVVAAVFWGANPTWDE